MKKRFTRRTSHQSIRDTLIILLIALCSIAQTQELTAEGMVIGIVILTEPHDAVKLIDGQPIGEGNTFMVTIGEHKLEVRKDGYHSHSATIQVDSENTLFQGIKLLQRPKPIVNQYGIFNVYDTPPRPVNGFEAIVRAARKYYPRFDLTSGIEGTVIVQAIIGSDGRASEAIVLRDVPHGNLGEAAVKVVTNIPWEPAIYQGQKVAVQISIPVVFKLR